MADLLNSTAEQNARIRARADYFRWLNKYYGSAELAEMSDEPEPVNLRQIFVPMRVDQKDLTETAMASPSKVLEQETVTNLPGRDAFDLIAEQPFVCLSGLPGSGKTTLIKALMSELCSNYPSRSRTKLEGRRGIAPIPLILREIPGIDRIRSLDELMKAWWQNLEQKNQQGDALDIKRLRDSFNVEKDNFPLLLLFDGIDETGGPDVRQTILDIAWNAHKRHNHRVLVTGRPNGFSDLEIPHLLSEVNAKITQITQIVNTSTQIINTDAQIINNDTQIVNTGLMIDHPIDLNIKPTTSCLYHLLPLAWPQIKRFIDHWYRLRPEWEIKRKDGSDHFLEALQDNNRSYLLPLARRPIFLTLMALVHCTRNEMPHGRADLYEAIVDLYLNRQERHRQLKYGTRGNVLKVWPVQEKRRVLGRIAFESQSRGADQQQGNDNPDQRRILWPHSELREFIAKYLDERAGSGGIAPEDAGELLEYYLHPAGLLISPTEGEICFAHLSFQEYLCAEDIQRRLSGRKFAEIFRTDLTERLNRPGWDEVGLLLLAIHKNRSEDGHLELLGLLHPQKKAEASLLMRGLTGKELGLTLAQQDAWLPVLFACCLLHPNAQLSSYFASSPSLEKSISALMVKLLRVSGADSDAIAKVQWQLLQQQAKGLPFDWVEHEADLLEKWLQPNWDQEGTVCAHLYSLLTLLVYSRDFEKNSIDWELQQELVRSMNDNSLLWRCINSESSLGTLPKYTAAGWMLDSLIPNHGPLWRYVLERMPLEFWLMPYDSDNGGCLNLAHATVFLAFYPTEKEKPPIRVRLALGLYQVLSLTDYLPLLGIWGSRLQSLLLWQALSAPLLKLGAQSQLPSQGLGLVRSIGRSRAHMPPQERGLAWSSIFTKWMFNSLVKYSSLSSTHKILDQILIDYGEQMDLMESMGKAEDPLEAFLNDLRSFSCRYAAYDWFTKQAEQPDLMIRRGLKPAEPLPRALGLFDERGMPLEQQQRQCWLKLQTWLQRDDEVLEFFFPEGLNVEEEAMLRADLEMLRKQPWSPQALVASVLNDWPENQPQRDFSFATAQDEILAACQAFLNTVDSGA